MSAHTTSAELAPQAPAAEAQENTAAPESDPQVEPTVHVAEEYTVTGKTSFQDLLNWGVPRDTIETVIGESMPAPQTLVKDYASAKGIVFSDLKGKLQEKVDAHK